MSRILILSLLLAFGCTHHQEERIAELTTTRKRGWNQTKAANAVRESRDYPPSNDFKLVMETSQPLETEKGTFPLYILKGINLPKNERLVLAEFDELENQATPLFEFTISESGELNLLYPIGASHPAVFTKVDGVRFGRPLLYIITSLKTGLRAEATFYPLPLEAHGSDGANLSLYVTHPRSTRFQLNGTAFQPNELIAVTHKSGSLSQSFQVIADEKGSFTLNLSPVEFGYLGGHASITASRTKDSITLDYPWGSRLEQLSIQKREISPIVFQHVEPENPNTAKELAASLLFN